MSLVLEGPLNDQASVCIPLLRLLPDWFGDEAAILNFEREIDHLPTFLFTNNGPALGFFCLKQHTFSSTEILVMAVQPTVHRGGIGRSLVAVAKAFARSMAIAYMQLKTLGPSNPDPGHVKTRTFYEPLGYRPMDEFL